MILETERLILREMTQADFPALCKILQDAEVMRAYEHAFSDLEAQQWLDRQRARFCEHGLSLWAAVLRETGDMIGQCGITLQQCGTKTVPEIGYLFQKAFWHRGYATEAAVACRRYAFEQLDLEEIYSIIRDSNLPSQRVALRNAMTLRGSCIKQYYGLEMPHLIFSARRDACSE
ncbi:MAG: GNAT family N-acetyltransferase, partial [Oscillospiraceae bacterium]